MHPRTTSRLLGTWVDPETAFVTLFATSANAFWLDSGPTASTGYSYLGDGSTVVTASVADGTVTTSSALGSHTTAGSIFDALSLLLADGGPAPVSGDFAPGWVGWLGYEAGASETGTRHHTSRYPDAAFLQPRRLLVFDHAQRTVTAIVTGDTADTADEWGWLSPLGQPLDAAIPEPHPAALAPARWRHSRSAYGSLITRAQEQIRAGNAYQLCLTNEVLVDGSFDPVAIYRRLRHTSPSHHGGLLRFGDIALVSSSPEQFLRIAPDGTITTRPIKGTRPRGSDIETDAIERHSLLASEKERAENLMIVDLMRNDLGRVAALGSVRVTELLAVESYAQVHQLVSTVTARLAPGLSAVDAVAAAFPAGSMTGAPKMSAMAILDGLEAGPRGVYSGAFGYVGLDGSVDLAMVIRSILIDPAGAAIGTGGGITALSVVDEEIEETRLKAAALLDALGIREQEVG
ncbi:aminodeoxychorismate synthase component I [Okibacterium sp. HSC-33S16]|uniref:aminodeoxychorismate synthase component I n=1 Tax=Okibacterium sp. HSC-33S16 TaxID=2910965 RepID=UPI0020A08DBA|nr:aminodeoxychorismate synthase component I [Okibacterium sp. HSC-33S16]MCP2030692.1 aminodeoxychorismate synthase component I [Okibacterium sp. HSC-33S16]